MTVKSFQNLLLLFIFVLLSACSAAVDPSQLYKDETPQQIYQQGKKELKSKNYNESVKRFEALDIQYPDSRDNENAQLYLIYAYYMKEDYALTVATADRYIRMYPRSENVDYAYYMRGISNFYQNLGVLERMFKVDLATRDLTQIRKSYADFNELVQRFPSSRYTPSAHQYLVYLRNVMADHELHIAEYYYERGAYAAAANRASNIVAHYEGAPAVKEALILMIKSYGKLGLAKQQQDAYKVLQYNYPNEKITDR